MRRASTIRWGTLTLALAAGSASAEWRCDCTTILDSCAATVTVADDWVDITSDHRQCARVDYFIDGIPFVAMVVGGEERQDWLARSADPDILVQSCQVCVDRAGTGPAAAMPAAADGTLAPIIQVTAGYPEAATIRGVEGFAEVSFTVTPFGEVQAPAVTAAEPAGVFEQAALDAISRWRYPIDEDREPTGLTHRFEFRLDEALLALTPGPAVPATARQLVRERNQCVRETASYNYGEMIEVGLINACDEPLVVYSCAEGTGQFASQWVCTSTARNNAALVRPNDGRIGTTVPQQPAANGAALRFTGETFVARAPNSQYWWLACAAEDMECRGSGEQWLRSIDRQLASVDPQSRIRRPLARAN